MGEEGKRGEGRILMTDSLKWSNLRRGEGGRGSQPLLKALKSCQRRERESWPKCECGGIKGIRRKGV